MNKLKVLPIISMIFVAVCFTESKAQDIKPVKANKTVVKSDSVSVAKKQKKQEKKKQQQKKQKGDTFTIGVSPEKKVKAEQAQ